MMDLYNYNNYAMLVLNTRVYIHGKTMLTALAMHIYNILDIYYNMLYI